MDRIAPIRNEPGETPPDVEENAPRWQIRCLNCDCARPWDKFGIRPKMAGKEFTVIHCPQCKRIRMHLIENVPPAIV